MFPPNGLPLPGEILLLTDELLAPADFLLHRHLATHLKESRGSRCLLVSISEDIGRWKAIGSRSVSCPTSPRPNNEYLLTNNFPQTLNLVPYLDSGALTFVDAMSFVSPSLSEKTEVPLQALFRQVKMILTRLSAEVGSTVSVILDDIASLEWMGIPAADITRFARALCALCRKVYCCLFSPYRCVRD